MRRVAAVAVAALAFAFPAAAAEPPTIIVNPNVIGRTASPIVFQGTVPGAGPGVEVKIEAKGCGETFFRLFGLTHTGAGGSWRWEPTGYAAYIRTNTLFRARANSVVSDPFTVRRRVYIDLRKIPATRKLRVGLVSEFVNLHRKPVRLERFTGGRWVLLRTAKLTKESYGSYAATFLVKQRGLQLRAVAPESLVKACYAAGVSAIVRT